MTALAIDALRKSYGALVVTDDVSLDVPAGELHAFIGPNGAGKTTLISQLSGQVASSGGRVRLFGEDVTRLAMPGRARRGLVRSFQITALCREYTTLDNVLLAVAAQAGHAFRFLRGARDDRRLLTPAHEALDTVGLGARADVPAGTLAHGEQRQLELAVALALKPRVLLLDEPMAGMGPEESAAVVALLRRLKGTCTILLVEHDMDAVFALADRVSVLVYGRRIATGAPAAIRADRGVRDAYLGEEALDAGSA